MTALRDPFPTNTIKVKPQSVTQDQSKGLVTYYVDARIVAERLNEAVGSDNWTDEYRVISGPHEGTPVECRLTVNGVTKCDVGQVKPGELDDKSWKSAYSDAFKRAAVKFGVGAYLYESPNVWAETKVGHNGKAQGFSENGRAHALQAYAQWIGDSQVGAASQGAAGGAAPKSPPKPDGGHIPSPPPSGTPNDDWKWPFGKWKGKTLAETDDSYLDWFMEKSDKEDIKDRIRAFRLESELVEVGGGEFVDDDIPFAPTVDGVL